MQNKKRPNLLQYTRIILDTGPLVVFLGAISDSGCFDEECTSKACNNASLTKFYKENGETFLKVISKIPFKLTPHVIAETSNFLKNSEFDIEQIFDANRGVIKEILLKSTEEHIMVKDLFANPIFISHKDLGITDCILMAVTKTDLLLTHDGPLRQRAKELGINAMLPYEFLSLGLQ